MECHSKHIFQKLTLSHICGSKFTNYFEMFYLSQWTQTTAIHIKEYWTWQLVRFTNDCNKEHVKLVCIEHPLQIMLKWFLSHRKLQRLRLILLSLNFIDSLFQRSRGPCHTVLMLCRSCLHSNSTEETLWRQSGHPEKGIKITDGQL